MRPTLRAHAWEGMCQVESLDNPVCLDVTGRKGKGLRVALASQQFDVVVIMGARMR